MKSERQPGHGRPLSEAWLTDCLRVLWRSGMIRCCHFVLRDLILINIQERPLFHPTRSVMILHRSHFAAGCWINIRKRYPHSVKMNNSIEVTNFRFWILRRASRIQFQMDIKNRIHTWAFLREFVDIHEQHGCTGKTINRSTCRQTLPNVRVCDSGTIPEPHAKYSKHGKR